MSAVGSGSPRFTRSSTRWLLQPRHSGAHTTAATLSYMEDLIVPDVQGDGQVLRRAGRRTLRRVQGSLLVEILAGEATVKAHLLYSFARLRVDDRTAAVTAAMERGVLRLAK